LGVKEVSVGDSNSLPVPSDGDNARTAMNDSALPELEPQVISCERVGRLLGDYLARTLPAQLYSQVEWHIHYCPSCSRDADEYTEVIRLAGTQPPVLPPPDVEKRLRTFIAAALRRPADGSADQTRVEPPLS
jgi:hypothetical protein